MEERIPVLHYQDHHQQTYLSFSLGFAGVDDGLDLTFLPPNFSLFFGLVEERMDGAHGRILRT